MKYLITGSRTWSDFGPISEFVKLLRPGDQVAHGAASRGADQMVHWMLTNPRSSVKRARRVYVYGEDGTIGQRREGNQRGDVDVNLFPANWERYRPVDPAKTNPAGFIRNEWMVRTFKPDVVVYFPAHGVLSGGTQHCVECCRRYGVESIYAIDEFIGAMARAEEDWEDA